MIDRIQQPDGFSAQVEQIQEQAREWAASAREQLADARQHVKNYISAHPERALAIALGMGVLVGWLTKRR